MRGRYNCTGVPSIQTSNMSSLKLNINGGSRERGVQVVLKEQKKQLRDKSDSQGESRYSNSKRKARPEIVGASEGYSREKGRWA